MRCGISLLIVTHVGCLVPSLKAEEPKPADMPSAVVPATTAPSPMLYVANGTQRKASQPQWPAQVVLQPGQRVRLQVPPFESAVSTNPKLVAVQPDPGHGLIRLHAVGSAEAISAATQPVGVAVKVDAKTTQTIPIVLRRDAMADLRILLKDIEALTVVQESGYVAVRGLLLDAADHDRLDQILAMYPGVLDLTGHCIEAPDKMIEIDVVIVVVNDRLVRRVGFDFLQAVQMHFDIFQAWHRRGPIGNLRPVPLDPTINPPTVLPRSQWGETLSATVDYNVNIANALDLSTKVIARPHLVTLNGQLAEFHAGGEIVFRLEGVQTAEIERFERGIILRVTPTLLKPLSPDSKPRVLVDAEITRISIADLLLGGVTGNDVDFDKTRVQSKTIMEMDQTLILSGIYQREYRKRNEGTPGLREIPGLKLFFTRESTLQDVVSTIVFLTPRDPAFVDKANEDATRAFVERRKEYLEARDSGDPERLRKFKEEHPNWMAPQPNRYATHFFLRDESTVYQELRGEDLRREEIRKDIISVPSAAEAERQGR